MWVEILRNGAQTRQYFAAYCQKLWIKTITIILISKFHWLKHIFVPANKLFLIFSGCEAMPIFLKNNLTRGRHSKKMQSCKPFFAMQKASFKIVLAVLDVPIITLFKYVFDEFKHSFSVKSKKPICAHCERHFGSRGATHAAARTTVKLRCRTCQSTNGKPWGSCGVSIGRVERMGDQELETAIVGLKEEVYLKDEMTNRILVPVPIILSQ
jgi:hypothetical protein